MDNRPGRLGNITAFRYSSKTVRLQFPDSFVINNPEVDLLVNNMPFDTPAPTIEIAGKMVSITYTVEQMRLFPYRLDFYFKVAGIAIVGGSFYTLTGFSDPTPGVFNVTFQDDHAISVFIPGYELIAPLVDRAEQAAEDAEAALDDFNEIINNFPEA